MLDMIERLSIAVRIWVLIAITLLIMASTAALDMNKRYAELVAEKKMQSRLLVDSVYSVIEMYASKESSGELSTTEAQAQALEAIKTIRYNESEYFWVNDMKPVMIMHPIKPALDGQNLSKIEDPNGKRLFNAFVDTVKRDGEGYVDYMWPKAGSEEPVEKISFVRGFSKWGWILGTGVYYDDIQKVFREELIARIIRLTLAIVAFGLIAIVIARSITSPLDRMMQAMSNISSGEADLAQRLPVVGKNEMASVAISFNQFVSRIQEVIKHVAETTLSINGLSENVKRFSTDVSNDIKLQQSDIRGISHIMNEMTSSVKDVASSASHASDAATQADKEASHCNKLIESSTLSTRGLAEGVSASSDSIKSVEEQSSNIDSVIDVIRGIADQTNLLALNAAIEAARAGEQGRGFAVVADEVRSLATKTQNSTQEIQDMIERLQIGTQKAVGLMETSKVQTEKSVSESEETKEALAGIISSVTTISDLNAQIAAAAEQQAGVAGDVDNKLAAVNEKADEFGARVSDFSESSMELQQTSHTLQELVARFRY